MSDHRTGHLRNTAWPAGTTRPVATPLQASVVYAAEDPDALDALYAGQVEGFSYAREGHPNAAVLAGRIDALEGMEGGLIVGSGMAAVAAVLLGLCRAGDHVLGARQLYGRSLRMLREDLPRLGIATSFADPGDADAVAAAITPDTRLILTEIVSNPMLRVADMAALGRIARQAGALLVVDNTFTTPRAVRATDLGADIVIHSVTKMLAGHSDVTLGYVAARDPAHRAALVDTATTLGLTPSPAECWLAERGLFTFPLRYDRAEANAAALADRIATHPAVSRCLYPGRSDHPDHARAADLLGGRFGTMVTFDLAGGRDAANLFVRAAPDLPFAPSLGDVATLISHPASSSHRALSPQDRAGLGIGEGTIRLSVGIEAPETLRATLAAALDAAQ